MVKSGQGKYQVKSRLNWLRELLLFITSIGLWSYCAGVIIVIAATITGVDFHIFQLIRTILNIESSEVTVIFTSLAVIAIFIIIYLICAYFITRRIRRMV